MHATHWKVVAGCLAAASLSHAPPVLAQANPALRGAGTTLRVATVNRLPFVVAAERVVSGLSPFPAACSDTNGTAFINAEVEPHIAINPQNPNHFVASWQQDRFSNGGARGLLGAVSFDGGETWTQSGMVASTCTGGEYLRATDPWVTFAADGTPYQTALGLIGQSFTQAAVNAILVAGSADGGRNWLTPATVIRDTGALLFNDKQTITADPTDARFVYAVWDRLRSGANGPTLFARTTTAGATWEPAREIYDPGSTNQTIGNVIGVLPNGTLLNLFTQLIDQPGGTTAASIAVIRSTDRGVSWSAPITISPSAPLGARDPHTGAAIRDGAIIPQIAIGPDGSAYAVWQDARLTGGQRDAIALSRSTDGGFTWSSPVRVNAEPGVWAFTPQVHVRADGMVGVTYFDLRSNTPDTSSLLTDYWLARSTDGGATWRETRVSPAFDISTAPNAGGFFLGDYMGLVSTGTDFIAFYTRTTGNLVNRTDAIFARIGPRASGGALVAKSGPGGEDGPAYRAAPLPESDPGPGFWREVSGAIERAMDARVPGWSDRRRR